MKQYKLLNNTFGWLIFIIASAVYIITSEPTASYWDCGEYIATAYKLQVGHPPGAPFFQLLGRFFSLFAGDNVMLVGRMVNTMSALASGATILFLFWTITALAKKIIIKADELSLGQSLAIIGSGIVGALAYTFSDSFWFSAVEGEVYATSSFFTAIVLWAMLKWDEDADDPYSYRWIVFIAFLMGLSVGVHLLNLLAIPAICFVYYFRKSEPSAKGILFTFVVSVVLLAAVMYGIIPQVVSLFAKAELVAVNGVGLPFNSGTLLFTVLVVVLLVSGLMYTYKNSRAYAVTSLASTGILLLLVLFSSSSIGDFFVRLLVSGGIVAVVILARSKYILLRTGILSLMFILIGYSSFLMLVIRSNADTPINENTPKDAISLLSYLNREQYGDWPLFYGQYFNAPLDSKQPYLDGNPVYSKDLKSGKYVIIDDRKNTIANYDSRFCTIFPRMWSNSQTLHPRGYQSWGQIEGTPITVTGANGKTQTIYKPTFIENLRYFFAYQLGHMYFRYFMWNFAGKQNDNQGHGGIINGNWISGINWLDSMRLGPQENLPEPMAKNKGTNKFYLLPLILGFGGFIFQLNKHYKGFMIVMLLFLFTGIAINVYLNPVPYQPRERDYAYAASFYAYAIWIGLGVLGLYSLLKRLLKPMLSAGIATVLCLLLVPVIMAKDGWDDHDRSGRTTMRDIATDYLNSCAPNAIIFTLGDNDTFPLWNVQEVEGTRTDVRVINLSLLNTDWYINQARKKAYNSEPLPFSLPREKYAGSKREYTFIYEDTTLVPQNAWVDLEQLVQFATSDDPRAMLETQRERLNYFPTANFSIPIDKAHVVKNGTVPPQFADSLGASLNWTIRASGVDKSELMVLDLLAHFKWNRPVYFAITTGDDAYLGLDEYLELDGLAYRLVPYKCNSIDGQIGRVNTQVMYDNVMNKFKWGNMANPNVYLDETNMRMCTNLRNIFCRLAYTLVYEGKIKEAVKVAAKCTEVMPDNCVPYNAMVYPCLLYTSPSPRDS